MENSSSWSQPDLFESRVPLRVRLEILLDPEDETGVVILEVRQFPGGELRALTSSAPVPFADIPDRVRLVGHELTELLHQHTGPF